MLRTARGYFLFYFSRLLRATPGFGLSGVELGENVRLQKNRSAMAEAPDARIHLGSDSIIYEDSKIEAYGKGQVTIGERSVLGGVAVSCRYAVRIGDRFLASWNVFIQDYDSHPVESETRAKQIENIVFGHIGSVPNFRGRKPEERRDLDGWNFPGEAVSIGNDVWVGANATILKGAHIGDGCIVAAGSVVLKGEYPPRSVIGGNPATIVKTLSD